MAAIFGKKGGLIPQERILDNAGKSDHGMMRMLQEEGHLDKTLDLEQLLDEKHQVYMTLQKEGGVRVFPGVTDFLDRTKDKFQMGVVSSSSRDTVASLLGQAGLIGLMDFVIGYEDVKNHKPDPEPYIKGSRKMNLPADQCLVIEDSVSGVAAAKSAGIRCVAITNTFSRDELKAADMVLSQLDELESHLPGFCT
jgi:HAD superfamily hydrolase (TIGR01509 family)